MALSRCILTRAVLGTPDAMEFIVFERKETRGIEASVEIRGIEESPEIVEIEEENVKEEKGSFESKIT